MYKSFFSSLALIILLFNPSIGYNQPVIGDVFSEESHLFTPIADVNLTSNDGEFMLSDVYRKSPVLIAFIFTRCAGVCNPFILELNNSLRAIAPKEPFKILVVSFDPEDRLKDMTDYSKRFGLENNNQWMFAITDQIDSLINSVGFHPVWDQERLQFDHDALLVGINNNGYISKKLIGIRDNTSLKIMLKSINNEFLASYPMPGKNSTFACFTYDPATGKKKASIGLLFLLIPVITTIVIMIWLATIKQNGKPYSV